ncbi:protein Vhl-like [Littorina saxatilis]|uniref:von Hippel-Lindau disease tumour suppressor beta domain-containing protein n=1 Tax=Littorina saxatilis TaxID=31220 RepID=A0AAN9B5E2_9CAEN
MPVSLGLPKSQNSQCQVPVTFVNTTQRTVDVYWVDFAGELVRYSNLSPGKKHHIYTYATHPWVARDCATGQRMFLSGQPVFVPVEPPADQDPDLPIEILIHIPLFRLEEICIGYFRASMSEADLAKMDVNAYIKQRLCNIPKLKATDYQPRRH